MSENDPILVAVDGSEGGNAAVRYGAAEANRLGTDLRILHAVPDYIPIGGMYLTPAPFTPDDLRATGEEILTDALRLARTLASPDRVTAQLATGDRVRAILDAATQARIVVLGAQRAPVLERLAVGSTVGNVAARAGVPVVAVPSDWAPRPAVEPVIVALKQYDAAPLELIDAGLERAAAQRTTLRLVHIWDFPGAYGDLVVAMMNFQEWAHGVEETLRTDAAEVFAQHPEVDVEVIARYGQPAKVLHELSEHAGLLVIARRAHAFPVGHFGSTGRALLRESRCPVEVLPIAEIAPASEPRAAEARIDA